MMEILIRHKAKILLGILILAGYISYKVIIEDELEKKIGGLKYEF